MIACSILSVHIQWWVETSLCNNVRIFSSFIYECSSKTIDIKQKEEEGGEGGGGGKTFGFLHFVSKHIYIYICMYVYKNSIWMHV